MAGKAQISEDARKANKRGAARLAAQSGEAPGVLRAQVTSKGGTTEAALRVFAEERLA